MWQVVGQERAISLLKSSLEKGNLSHAYLFVGPRHVGKLTLAMDLARAVNCEDSHRPCGECKPCTRISAGKHADVRAIELIASEEGKLGAELGIDQIRELQHAASLKPYEGRYRVFIIDGAERLTNEAANCLLKTLEEPPPNVLLILLAVKEDALLPTVLSRCHRVELRPLPLLVVEQALVERGVAIEKARLLARLCRGCIGWALSVIGDEQLLAERSEKLGKLVSLSAATREERFNYAAQLAAQLESARESVRETLDLWIDWWRDLMLVKGDCPGLITNVDQEPALRRQAEGYTMEQIKVFIEDLRSALEQLDQNANPRLVFEVLMLNMPPRGELGSRGG